MFKPLHFHESGLNKREWQTLKKLNTPAKIQDFLNKLPFNHEEKGETYMSVSEALRMRRAHCFEGALIAAAALWVHGERPLLLDLSTDPIDDDHVVALFKKNGFWGAISKTNHTILRYREPVYKSVRELAMSYFHEYFLTDGSKTMRRFSKPYHLPRKNLDWLRSKEPLFSLVDKLDMIQHINVLTPAQIKNLRPADKIERRSLALTEWKKKF